MNRAAEAAVPQAKVLLVNAAKQMTVSDAKQILTGGRFGHPILQGKTEDDLAQKMFLPEVKKSTDKLSLSSQYNKLAGKASGFGLVDKGRRPGRVLRHPQGARRSLPDDCRKKGPAQESARRRRFARQEGVWGALSSGATQAGGRCRRACQVWVGVSGRAATPRIRKPKRSAGAAMSEWQVFRRGRNGLGSGLTAQAFSYRRFRDVGQPGRAGRHRVDSRSAGGVACRITNHLDAMETDHEECRDSIDSFGPDRFFRRGLCRYPRSIHHRRICRRLDRDHPGEGKICRGSDCERDVDRCRDAQGTVQLSGFAKSKAERTRAEALARDPGVRQVKKNDIVVRP